MREKHCENHRIIGGKKLLIMLASLVLVFCTVIGGTLAWLVVETKPVVNTFTYGNINITLTETDTGDNDNDPNTNKYVMIPGNEITKDPLVTVEKGSESNWLFVKVTKSDNFNEFMTYEIADGWTIVDGENDVYYREVSFSNDKQEFNVIKNNKVTVKGEEITKEKIDALTDSTLPKLTITAYAVQKANINSVADAWGIAKGN